MRSTVKALLIGITVSSVFFAAAESADHGGFELLADTGGRIEQTVISVNSARRAVLRNAELISNIVNGLPTATRFGIITNDRKAFTVASNPWPERVRFLELPADNPITIWTQDPFLVLRDSDGHVKLLVPREFERAGDRAMAALVADTYGYETAESKLFFEGGNIVADEWHAFIGADTIRYNAKRWMATEEQIVALFEQELGRPVLVIGPSPQPIGHIDMMLTPLGNGRVALADAAAGAAVVEQAINADETAVRDFEQTTQDYFFGAPGITRLAAARGNSIEAPELLGKTGEMVAASKKVAPLLDGIATALAQHGYDVVRIPFLYGGPGADPGADAGREKGGSAATYPMLTYNNVLVEQDEKQLTVYLPRYGLTQLDAAAVAAWAKLGFATRPVDGLTVSAMYGGALRCSVKVLERSHTSK